MTIAENVNKLAEEFVKSLKDIGYENYHKTTEYKETKKSMFGYFITNNQEFEALVKREKIKNLIDLGCGAGIILKAAQDNGIKVKGFELDPKLIFYAKKLGVPVKKKDILKITTKDLEGFDNIYFWEPLADYELAEKFVANLMKVSKGKTIYYKGYGGIKSAFEKRKHEVDMKTTGGFLKIRIKDAVTV